MYAISPVFNLVDALRACECGDRGEETSHLAPVAGRRATTITTMDNSDNNNDYDDDDDDDDDDERSYF